MITSPTNARVKQVRRLQADRRFRLREQAFVVEGDRWLAELIRQALPPRFAFYTESWRQTADNAYILTQLGAPVQLVSDALMTDMSDTESPPGILAVVPIRPKPLPARPSLLLVLDAITNPGNLGAMLRTAGAAGVEGALLGPGCVDAYNPKVVRGGMGIHLRLPLQALTWAQMETAVTGLRVWAAAADGNTPYTAVPWQEPSALIIGNEARGASQAALALAHGRITIPMRDATESLNAAVAAGVILFEAVRQRETHGQ
jgi:RNA methyltransferase, TrmH family